MKPIRVMETHLDFWWEGEDPQTALRDDASMFFGDGDPVLVTQQKDPEGHEVIVTTLERLRGTLDCALVQCAICGGVIFDESAQHPEGQDKPYCWWCAKEAADDA